ncbi:MAG: hypothetical protein K2X60_01940 [Xanthobacteraceae bacterium]|nr:hypothetical protein [Xanthobacteraceae bacterium]
MTQIEPNVPALLWFVLLWSVCCLGFFQLAGMYPIGRQQENAPGRSTLFVLANTVLWLALMAGTLMFAYAQLRWTTTVVVGGILFLFIPEAFQALPGRWKDGRPGLAAAAIIMAAALGLLASFDGPLIRSLLT